VEGRRRRERVGDSVADVQPLRTQYPGGFFVLEKKFSFRYTSPLELLSHFLCIQPKQLSSDVWTSERSRHSVII
jgi:hypothetical protein